LKRKPGAAFVSQVTGIPPGDAPSNIDRPKLTAEE
jgi:hypothetical protein